MDFLSFSVNFQKMKLKFGDIMGRSLISQYQKHQNTPRLSLKKFAQALFLMFS